MVDRLDSDYVREYYDTYVGALTQTYEDHRWHDTPAKELEYGQTKRSLEAVLGSRRYTRALEVGPGDGVWTVQIKQHADHLHLVEQSQEMLEAAERRLDGHEGISMECADVLQSRASGPFDLVVAMRCFEYFSDKPAVLQKLFASMGEGARLVIVTKSPKLLRTSRLRKRTLHSGQVTREEMIYLLRDNGFLIESIFPAVFRLHARNVMARWAFTNIHRLMVATRSRLLPVSTYATESYVYSARRA